MISVPAVKSQVLAISGANGAVSADGCSVSLVGSNDHGIVSSADTPAARTFSVRANLSLCGVRAAAPLPTVVNPAPRGGESNCWTTRVQEDAAASPRFAGLRQAMLAAEDLLKKNAAFMAAPQPVRYRTSLSAGPSDDGGARMHVKAVPERKSDGTRVWSTGCEVIPQIDRIGGAIAQISIFFNQDARGQFINPVGDVPKLTGTVAGYPEYEGWVLITKDKRVPWLPQTLADRLDEEAAKREKALAEAKRRPAGIDDAGAGSVKWLEKQVRDLQQYRASFSAEQLRAPGVWGDPTGAGRKRLEAEAAAMRKLSPADQQQADTHRAREPQSRTTGAGRDQEQERRRSGALARAIERTGDEGPRDPAGAHDSHRAAHPRCDGDVRPDEPSAGPGRPRDEGQARSVVSRCVDAEPHPGDCGFVLVWATPRRRATRLADKDEGSL